MTHYNFESNSKVINQVGRPWETLAVALPPLQCHSTEEQRAQIWRWVACCPCIAQTLLLGVMAELYSFLVFDLRCNDPKLCTHQFYLATHWRGSNQKCAVYCW